MTRGASPSRANPNQYHAFRDPALPRWQELRWMSRSAFVKPQTATVPWNVWGPLMMGPPSPKLPILLGFLWESQKGVVWEWGSHFWGSLQIPLLQIVFWGPFF